MLLHLMESGRQAHRTGAWDDALAHYETALTLASEHDEARHEADLHKWMGMVHAERGTLGEAARCFDLSRNRAESAGFREQVGSALICHANLEMVRGDLDSAADLYLQAREIALERDQERSVAIIDQNLGIIANIRGNVALALLSYRSASERFKRLEDDTNAARALMSMGMAHVDLSEWDAADSCFTESAASAERSGDALMSGNVELNRAELHLKRRRWDAARESVDQSLSVFNRLRTKPNIAEAYKFYGVLFRETGKPEQSDTHFALSLGMAESCENRLLQAETQLEWAILHLEEQRKQEGVLYLNRALGLFREMKANREVVDIQRRLDRLTEMYLPAVNGWGAELSESKDPYQNGHAQRVAAYSVMLAREVGVSGWDLSILNIGAHIHDVGNVAVPAEVLRKEEALNDNEREIMQVHAILGESMAERLHFPEEVRPIIRSHHERWGGHGYPDGLAGEKIPFAARIVSIADVFDALTSPR
ncbi:MAG: tetratricopeptide repeat protein, partial [Gemmatimonadetes bacterium]|nr:tetratricopeptide repeat protein [Gemmatimonadota bacterium]